MIRSTHISFGKIIVAGAVGAGIALAAAQSVAAELEEVIVTAQKRAESANDIGMAISAISGNVLDEQGISDTASLASLVPGFTFAESFNGTPIYTLRGVGFDDNSVQAAATVGVYLDEIAIPYPVMTRGANLDVQRVEVLKGPQGTLFGRNSTGGAINYIANKPGDEFEASATAGYGSFQQFGVRGFISAPLSDSVGVRFAGRTVQSGEGWQESVSTGTKLGEKNESAFRGMLDLNPSDKLSLTLTANWWQDKSEPQAPVSLDFEYQDPTNTPVTDIIQANTTLGTGKDNTQADWTQNNSLYQFKNNLTYSSITADLRWDLTNSVEVTSLTSYSQLEDDNSLRNNDGMSGVPQSALVGWPSLVPGSNGNQANYNNYSISDIEAVSQELRLSGSMDSFNWIVGLYYATDTVKGNRIGRFDFTSNTDFAPDIQFDNLENRADVDSDLWAIFTHGEFQLTDAFQLTVGLRYSEDQKDFVGCTADTGVGDLGAFFGAPAGGCISANDIDGTFNLELARFALDEDSVSGRLGLDYSLNDDVLLYGSYSRGFKAGGFPTVDSILHSQFAPVVQERLDAWELGFKSTLADGAAQLNAGVFFYDYKDKQLSGNIVTAFGILTSLVNAPKSEVTGAEIDLQWALSESWYASIAAAHVKTEIKEFTGVDTVGNTVDFAGDEFPNSPETTASASVTYDTEFGNSLRGGFGLSAIYQSDMKAAFSSDPRFVIDSYTLLNARAFLGAADNRWLASLWVHNATDEYYLLSIANGVDTISGYTGMPLTYGVEFTYNW